MKQILISLLCVFLLMGCAAKTSTKGEGANDKKSNSDPIAYTPELITDSFSSDVEEQSGLALYQDLFWVINDSFCEAELIAYDSKGKIQRRVDVKDQANIDWEDLAEDEKYIYIGDFGNNRGNRRNLRVLRVEKSSLAQSDENGVTAQEIKFSWADQKDFSDRLLKNDYDCEAFFAWGDSLYLFSKDWVDLKTRMYRLPKDPGDYQIKPQAQYNIDFHVTAADISKDGKSMALLGYKNYHSYLTVFYDYEGTDFFNGKHIALDLSVLGACQTEGVVFGNDDQLFISCEKSATPSALYRINWTK